MDEGLRTSYVRVKIRNDAAWTEDLTKRRGQQ